MLPQLICSILDRKIRLTLILTTASSTFCRKLPRPEPLRSLNLRSSTSEDFRLRWVPSSGCTAAPWLNLLATLGSGGWWQSNLSGSAAIRWLSFKQLNYFFKFWFLLKLFFGDLRTNVPPTDSTCTVSSLSIIHTNAYYIIKNYFWLVNFFLSFFLSFFNMCHIISDGKVASSGGQRWWPSSA